MGWQHPKGRIRPLGLINQPINQSTNQRKMYFPYFITYIVAGLAITLVVFFWALKNGQFRDQQRARYLPLQGDSDPTEAPPTSAFSRIEIYGLFLLAVAGLGASAAVLVFAIIHGGAG
jgi:cbb3-type cytochrome oxidase maturation protein